MLVKYHRGLCVFGRGQRSLLGPLLPAVSISMVKPGHRLTLVFYVSWLN